MALICLLRHAEPELPDGSRFSHDSERPLSARGRESMGRAAAGIRAIGLSFDLILHSPYLRAMETAEIVAAALGARDRLDPDVALSAGACWDEVRRALGEREAAASVLIVGHEPDLSTITSEIIGARRGCLDFGKGTLACVAVNEIPPTEPGILRNLLRIEQLASLSGQ